MTTIEPTAGVTLTLFERHVKQALRLYDQSERLGRETPLASPYVLGRALRPERPRPPQALYGYDKQLALLTDALAHGRSVGLSGPGGVGKTSISATAVEQLGDHPTFWYTLRPGFNDGASSLLFALGAFLHEHGAPNLWQYLVTANGVVGDLNLAAGLLRQDLATFTERPPIICLDDLEHLSTGNLAPLAPAYAQLLDLVEGLRGAALADQPAPAAGDRSTARIDRAQRRRCPAALACRRP